MAETDPSPAPSIAALAAEYWDLLLDRSPLAATFYGDHRADHEMDDLSEAAEDAYVGRISALRHRVAAVPVGALDRSAVVTRGLLLAEIDKSVSLHPHRLAELSCDQMTGPHADLLMVWPQLSYPTPEQADSALQRLADVPRFLRQAAERFRAGAALGRVPARIGVVRSLSQIDGYLARDIDDDPFLRCRLPVDGTPGWSGSDEWRQRAAIVVAGAVRPAFEEYRAVLRDVLLPVARPDDRAGLCWLPDGEAVYAALVAAHTSVRLTPAEIHARGIDEVESLLPPRWRELGVRVFGTEDLAEVFGRLRTDPDLRFADGEEILATARAVVERAGGSLAGWFGRLPAAPCLVEPVPEFLAADAPPAYYFPPAPDGSRPGTYFVNTSDASSRPRFELESVAFHEAVPGHHLQLAVAAELDGVPDFQKHVGATAYVEGWGLYAERLADEMGLYSDDVQRLGMLSADAWRAGRLVVDTGIHAYGWSRDRAAAYLTEWTPVPVDTIGVEVDRYVVMAAQALAYKVGQHEILRLREEARGALGAAFDVAAFHDAVLGSGAVTLGLLGDLVTDWVESHSR